MSCFFAHLALSLRLSDWLCIPMPLISWQAKLPTAQKSTAVDGLQSKCIFTNSIQYEGKLPSLRNHTGPGLLIDLCHLAHGVSCQTIVNKDWIDPFSLPGPTLPCIKLYWPSDIGGSQSSVNRHNLWSLSLYEWYLVSCTLFLIQVEAYILTYWIIAKRPLTATRLLAYNYAPFRSVDLACTITFYLTCLTKQLCRCWHFETVLQSRRPVLWARSDTNTEFISMESYIQNTSTSREYRTRLYLQPTRFGYCFCSVFTGCCDLIDLLCP